MNQSDETQRQENPQTGPEQGLRSGSTAGDSHGQTDDAPQESGSVKEGVDREQTPGERRKELLKED